MQRHHNSRGEKGMMSSRGGYYPKRRSASDERPRLSQPRQQQQPPAALGDSTPRMHRRRSCGSGSCGGDMKRTPQKQASSRDVKSLNDGAAASDYYVQSFQCLSGIWNRKSAGVGE